MKKFKITKEQVIQLAKNNQENKEQLVDDDLRNWFPEAFKTKFTGWAKDIHEFNKEWIAYYENDILRYGINASGEWFEAKSISNYKECDSNRLATEQEVKTALINEANKKYPLGTNINCLVNKNNIRIVCEFSQVDYYFDENDMYLAGACIFEKGKWATITETITKEEAEKLLNKKII